MGWHPFHAFGVADTDLLAMSDSCNTLVHRYAYQNADAAGHVEIEQAIAEAERKLKDWLGYSVAPHYVSEVVPWSRLADGMSRGGAYDADGRWLSVQLSEGYVQAVGVEALSVISAGAAVTYSDTDGDTIEDTFTIGPIATTVTDVDEIALYFASGDRFTGPDFESAVGERWRILPIVVTLSGGNVTIRGPKQLLVKPIKYEGVVNIGSGLLPNLAGNFATVMDVYRRYTNRDGTTVATSQAVIEWETAPVIGCCGSVDVSTAYSGSPYDPAAVAQAAARVGLRDARRGIVTPAEAAYNTDTGIWSSLDWTVCAEPDRVLIRYLAGYPLDATGQMDAKWRRVVAYMAAAELDKTVCACDAANARISYWQFDLARTAGANDEQYGTTQQILDCPFGTRRGQVYAWRNVQQLRQLRGFAAG